MKFNNIFTLINISAYFLLESIIFAIPIYFAYINILEEAFAIHFSYAQIAVMLWIIKIAFFDIFKFNLNIKNKQN